MILRYLSYLKNILVREPFFVCKYYLHKRIGKTIPAFVFMADGKMVHGGMFDRLKGAVSIYALSKVHGKQFLIEFSSPFDLSVYLQPNKYNWTSEKTDIKYAYPYSRPIIAYSENLRANRLLKKKKGQIHFYFGGDILGLINETYGQELEWSTLFNELFVPSTTLSNFVDERKKEIGCCYDAVHLRFVNLLGDNIEKNHYKVLTSDKQAELILSCCQKVKEIYNNCHNEGRRLIVASDSERFLKRIEATLQDLYIVSGRIVHVDKIRQCSQDENLKLFADMYLLAGANKVYSVIGNGLYPSAFPEYSAKIGNTKFERISL